MDPVIAIFPILYIATIIYVVSLLNRIANGVDRIARSLETTNRSETREADLT